MTLFEFGEIEGLKNDEAAYKTFHFVLKPHTFEYALEVALTNTEKEALILVMTSSTLDELKTMFDFVEKDKSYEIRTKFGSFSVDIEEELVDRAVLFQKSVRTIKEGEKQILQTVPVVILNYCLSDDENAHIIHVEKMMETQKWLEENLEIKQVLDQALEKSLSDIFGIGKPSNLSDKSEDLIRSAVKNILNN